MKLYYSPTPKSGVGTIALADANVYQTGLFGEMEREMKSPNYVTSWQDIPRMYRKQSVITLTEPFRHLLVQPRNHQGYSLTHSAVSH